MAYLLSIAPMAEKAQQDPQDPWFFTLLTALILAGFNEADLQSRAEAEVPKGHFLCSWTPLLYPFIILNSLSDKSANLLRER